MPLTKQEKRSLRRRKDKNISKGRLRSAAPNKRNRLQREQELLQEAKADFSSWATDPLFLTGVSLYWAEGAKRNEYFSFMNSDVAMINVMLLWIEKFTHYSRHDLGYRLYIHKPYAHEDCEQWWQKHIAVGAETFKKTVYKPSGLGVKKRPNYKGCLRIEVPKSINLLRKMQFWQGLLVEYCDKQ